MIYKIMLLISVVVTSFFLSACSGEPDGVKKTLSVTATAYTMREEETKKGNIGLAAWGDQLEPGMKSIAVSRDLIPMGLGHEAKVKIEGLNGYYVVRDKMNKRWKKKIDVFMGTDVEAAREWGKKKDIQITWWVPEEE